MQSFRSKITKPSDCALAIALPLTQEDFYLNLASDTEKDFVRSIFPNPSLVRQEALWEMKYLPEVVEVVNKVASYVETCGVKVFRDVSLNDFENIFRDFEVVTLVAHWRASNFRKTDFVNPNTLLDLIMSSEQNQIQFIQNSFRKFCKENKDGNEYLSPIRSTAEINEFLSKFFNKLLDDSKFHKLIQKQEILTDKLYTKYKTRLTLDSLFDSYISPGNRIELFDGLLSVEKFLEVIPNDYSGVFDFVVCNSVLIGNVIKKHRKCIVLVNEKPAILEYRLAVFYRTIISLLNATEIHYVDAAAAVAKNYIMRQ
jgi:hypothetical protein